MRVLIAGDGPTAKALRGQLARHDFHLTSHHPHLTIRIEEPPDAIRPLLDGVGGELERALLRHLRRQTSTPIEIHTAGDVQSSEEVRIVVPPMEEERRAVEVAAFRALLELSGQSQMVRKPWWKFLLSRKTK
ncbi:MAG TPA: hypothetical protein VK335_09715 [Bryobacteraceae bacterium]|nr:hypothetical protein [Bryobacteraceae bacterium]